VANGVQQLPEVLVHLGVFLDSRGIENEGVWYGEQGWDISGAFGGF
jgi:hypothetical protein